jgi:uncharacterized protein with PIN domain
MPGRKLRLAVACPHCHLRPRLRTCEAQRLSVQRDDPEEYVVEYQCQGCNREYWITKKAFQEAA